MRVIAICNQKGGVGKTTTAVSLAAGLNTMGFKTLLIDTDPQGNSTDTYNAGTDGVATLYDLLLEGEAVNNCIQHCECGDIIASDPLLREAETKFPADASRFFTLKKACRNIEGYDYVIIDTPPVLGVILANVLTYTSEVIVPITADRYGLQGIDQLLDSIENTREYTNPNLAITGILLVKYHGNYSMDRQFAISLPAVSESLKTKVFDEKIRESVSCRKAQAARSTIYKYDSVSTTAGDYLELCRELVNQEGNYGKE
jgi:chromosome partitioning protein